MLELINMNGSKFKFEIDNFNWNIEYLILDLYRIYSVCDKICKII